MGNIRAAIKKVDRAGFVPQDMRNQAGRDIPLPIGFGQTISQPSTVAYMLQWLNPCQGEKILDVGSGSGWTTALLSELVGPLGYVYAIDIVPELVEFGRKNCEQCGVTNAQFFNTGSGYGLPQYAPYDKILVSAAARALPHDLLDQLKPGGKMVIPVQSDILEITKTTASNYTTVVHSGFVFVPLVKP